MIGTPTLIISHRGNLEGPNTEHVENRIGTIENTIVAGFSVELDIWLIGNKYYVGHDKPKFHLEYPKLKGLKDKILFHAKNLAALEALLLEYDSHVFWHQKDDFALTNRNFIVTYPGQPLTYKSIVMEPERYTVAALKGVYAICTDYPLRWKEALCS